MWIKYENDDSVYRINMHTVIEYYGDQAGLNFYIEFTLINGTLMIWEFSNQESIRDRVLDDLDRVMLGKFNMFKDNIEDLVIEFGNG